MHKFLGYNLEVTRQFASTFDRSKAQIGNLILSILEEYISQVIGLPQTREKWLKKQYMDEKSWTPYINKSRKVCNWVNGVSRSWLKSPWDDITYLIQKYVTCEGRYSLIFLYHIRILHHLSNEKPMNMPYFLLQSLKKMSSQVKKNKNKERSMCHHGLIKMLVEHELNQRGLSWNIFLWENGFIKEIGDEVIETSPPMKNPQEPISPPRRIT